MSAQSSGIAAHLLVGSADHEIREEFASGGGESFLCMLTAKRREANSGLLASASGASPGSNSPVPGFSVMDGLLEAAVVLHRALIFASADFLVLQQDQLVA